MIAEVIINSNVKELNRTFDYNVPKELQNDIKIGSRVLVQFGNIKKLEEAFVINFKETTEYKTKNISKIGKEILNEDKIELAKWIAKRYFCNLSDSIKLMLPPGTTTKNIEKRVREKSINFVSLKGNKEDIENKIANGKIKSEKHIRVLEFLIENGEIPLNILELSTETSRAIIKTLEKNGYIEIEEKQIDRNPFANKIVERSEKLQLTEEQQYAYEKIEESIDDRMNSEFLIYGVTGSRKNRNIFTTNRESFQRKQNKYYVSSRNFTYTSNGK